MGPGSCLPCLTGAKLGCITLCGLTSPFFDKPDYNISWPYICNIARTLLSLTELGHRHHMEGVTEPLTRVLQKHHLTFLDKPLITLQQQFRAPKSRPSLDSETKAVYKIPCANCLWCYIGETGRAFNTRKKNISQKTKQQFMPGHAITLLTLKTLLLLVKVTPNADKIIMSLPGQYNILFNKHS